MLKPVKFWVNQDELAPLVLTKPTLIDLPFVVLCLLHWQAASFPLVPPGEGFKVSELKLLILI